MQEASVEDLSVGRMCGKSPGYATPEGGSKGVAELIASICAYILCLVVCVFSIKYRTSFRFYARSVFVVQFCLRDSSR